MQGLSHILAVTLKELRELVHRPMLVLTLLLGPLSIMLLFALGSNTTPTPPRAIVVVPAGQAQPRLLRDYARAFEQALTIAAITSDEGQARAQLRSNRVEAVVI